MSVVAALLILLGSLVIFAAAVGLVRLDGVFLRLHAASKPASLGIVLILLGMMLALAEWGLLFQGLAIIGLLFLKNPVAAQAIARATYFLGRRDGNNDLVLDEWERDRKR